MRSLTAPIIRTQLRKWLTFTMRRYFRSRFLRNSKPSGASNVGSPVDNEVLSVVQSRISPRMSWSICVCRLNASLKKTIYIFDDYISEKNTDNYCFQCKQMRRLSTSFSPNIEHFDSSHVRSLVFVAIRFPLIDRLTSKSVSLDERTTISEPKMNKKIIEYDDGWVDVSDLE